jgi:hypothetical protein
MKLFRCDHCGHTIYFENVVCESCGHALGYLPDDNALVSLEADNGQWTAPKRPGKRFVYCANAEYGACNWLIEATPGGEAFCRACRHNEVVPALSDPVNVTRWQTIERAKKRLMYSLLRFDLPLKTRTEDPVHGLSFRFLAEAAAPTPVLTGHENGIITLALGEADDAEREKRRTQLREPYRTLLGHFRHEIGHHYWDLLVANGPMQDEFRSLFGDETLDYMGCLNKYYAEGAPEGWQSHYISAYATAHPWEDFAETWAHFLHIIDTVEMASAFGVRMAPKNDKLGELTATIDFQPYNLNSIEDLIENWLPLSSLINNLNRAVGQLDAYPFVLTPPVIEKLGFIQRLIAQRRNADLPAVEEPVSQPTLTEHPCFLAA